MYMIRGVGLSACNFRLVQLCIFGTISHYISQVPWNTTRKYNTAIPLPHHFLLDLNPEIPVMLSVGIHFHIRASGLHNYL